MKAIELNDYRMAFEDQGKGIPIVFIHGYPLNSELWRPQIESLSNDFRVIAPDLRGHGKSQAPPGTYNMELLASDCNELLDYLKIKEKIIICGLSMGGYIAFAFHRTFRHRLRGMIFTATKASADTPDQKENREKSILSANERGIDFIIDSMLPKLLSPINSLNNPGLVDRVKNIMRDTSIEGIIGDLRGMKERPDSIPYLKEIQEPVLIIQGQDDQIIPMVETQIMQTHIPNCDLKLIPGAGHLPNLEKPEEFNQLVRLFLNNFLENKNFFIKLS